MFLCLYIHHKPTIYSHEWMDRYIFDTRHQITLHRYWRASMLNKVRHNQDIYFITEIIALPSVLWRCWLGGRKGIRPVKNLSGGVLAWLSVWNEMQTCIWPNWCHCHSLSLASVKSRLVLPFWYWLTWVVPEKGPLNGCVCVCVQRLFLPLVTS